MTVRGQLKWLQLALLVCLLKMPPLVDSQQQFTVRQVPNPFRVGNKYPPRSEVDVCRPIQDRIVRHSARYNSQLVTNNNPDIVFSTRDSRIMSSRLQTRLNTLATDFKTRFQKKMTVLKAWTPFPDPDLAGDGSSLHYEGRSVQVRLPHSSDYQAFLELAAVSFDWVFYASSNIVRLSVIPTNCERNIDCVFIVDESGSVGRLDYQIAKQFIENVVSFFSIGPSHTRVGYISFSSQSRIRFDLNAYTTLPALQSAIRSVNYVGGGTYTATALADAHLLLNPSNNYGARPNSQGIPKIAILITDGRSYGRPVSPVASTLKNSGVQVYTIGIGRYSLADLRDISSDPDDQHVFLLNSFRDALGFVDVLSITTCETQAIVHPCVSTTSRVSEGDLKYYQTECSSFHSSVLVELVNVEGDSFLYCSSSARNPGPLTTDTVKNVTGGLARRQCVLTPSQGSNVLFIGVEGRRTSNSFSVVISDNVFVRPDESVKFVEGSYFSYEVSRNLLPAASGIRFRYSIVEGNTGNVFTINSYSGQVRITSSGLSQINFRTNPQYSLTISANRQTSMCSCARLRLRVSVLHNRIEFRPQALPNIVVPEDTALGHDLVTITTTGEVGNVIFSFAPDIQNNPFSINARTGLIELHSPLDFETKAAYMLTIKAVSSSTSISGTITQSVSVSDVNESPFFVTPCAINLGCNFAIDENNPRGSLIGQVVGNDPDQRSSLKGTLSYRFQPVSSYFGVSSSGSIFTLKALDYEDSSTFSFELIVSDRCSGCSKSIRTPITINVNDVNDNAPVVSGPSALAVAENSIPGAIVTQYRTYDADSAENSRVQFSLSSSTPVPFAIDSDLGILTVTGEIDYERTREYIFTVHANNQGTTLLSTNLNVRVTVGNLNDETPVFTSSRYSVDLIEHSPLNSIVTTVKATDDDNGTYGMVRYSITDGNFDNSLAIDSISGEIRVTKDVDRETISVFRLTIQAVDLGRPQPRRATSKLQVTVTDINDNSPIFNPSEYNVRLREDITTGTEAFSVFAVDRDQPGTPNTALTYSIVTGNVGSVFGIDSSSGVVSVIAMLDFERESSYRLGIAATDSGSPQRAATAMATINVDNINEAPPTLSGNRTIDVSENQPVPSSVAKFDAEDPDQMDITFDILSGNEDGRFSIDVSTGTIMLVAPLDYEATQRYELEVEVSDGMQSTSATLTVNVLDINEFTPVFTSPSAFQVSEQEPNGTLVGTVVAEDRDGSSINSRVTYSFAQQSEISRYFQLDSDTGDVTTIGVLDREELTQVFLPPASIQSVDIVARDQGSPSRQSFTTISIKLVDINDNSPSFSDSSYHTSIGENGQSDLIVFQVSATDADLTTNSEIRFTFELSDGSVSSRFPFRYSEDRGVLYTTEGLDYEEATSYLFNVHATDMGNPSRGSTVQGLLNVTDENDNFPTFTMDPYTFRVTEGEDIHSLMLKVKAIDQDTGTNGDVVYSVINSRTLRDASYTSENQVDEFTFIQINSSTGELRPLTFFDYEREQRVNVTVVATDGGIPQKSGTATVFFEIVNVDESPPTFIGPCSVTVPENTSVNAILTRCTAVDPDSVIPPGNTDAVLIRYSIFSGNDDDMFDINSETGDIILLRELDRETRSVYNLQVKVRDRTDQDEFQSVEIAVSDTNDNPPEFTSSPYQFDFSVHRIRNHLQELTTIFVTDADTGVNGEVIYSIGDVTTNERNTVIEIIATDKGSPALSSSTSLTVVFERECLLQDFSIGKETGAVRSHVLCSVGVNAQTVNIVLGRSATMSCNALYNSRLTYQWVHNGSLITQPTLALELSTDFSYTLSEAGFDDAGQYACKVSSLAGSLQTREIMAEIQVPPTITVPPRDQSVKVGEEGILTCKATGIPDPNIQWFFRGTKKIHQGPTLVVSDMDRSKSGTYACVASNAVGDLIATANLIVYSQENIVELSLSGINNPNEDGSCHYIDYDSIKSSINKLTHLKTIITEGRGPDICNVSGPCMPSPCTNGSSCVPTDREVGGYMCVCKNGFTGRNCSQDVKECTEANPCENGGQCIEETGSYSCVCASMFRGHRCQYPDNCRRSSDLCDESMVCVDVIYGSHECVGKPVTGSSLTVTGFTTDSGFVDDYVQSYIERSLTSASTSDDGQSRSIGVLTSCVPRFIQTDSSNDRYTLLWLCPAGESPPAVESQTGVCRQLVDLGYVATCRSPGGEEVVATPVRRLPDTDATVGIILLKRGHSLPLSGEIAGREIEKRGIVSELERKSGMMVTVVMVQQSSGTGQQSGVDVTAATVTGVVLVLLILAVGVVTTILVVYKKHLLSQKQSKKNDEDESAADASPVIQDSCVDSQH